MNEEWNTPKDGLGPCPPGLEYPPLSGIHYDYELAQNEPEDK